LSLFLLAATGASAPAGTDSPTSNEQECEAGADGTCGNEVPPAAGTKPKATKCAAGSAPLYCKPASSLYSQRGGSAQAYKRDAPTKSTVCEPSKCRWKVASWPFRRGGTSHPAPTIEVSASDEKCCCSPLRESPDTSLEVWQTRPDGTYSSLAAGDDDECRATIPLSEDGKASYTTVAPGSTGILGGIGPGRWDWSPYGPPVMHMLVSGVDGHDSVLVHVPMLMDRKTLEPTSFWGPDWRGPAYFTPKNLPPFQVDSWEPSVEENKVRMEISIFLTSNQQSAASRVEDAMCKSWVYGLPSSFFLEPISICAPYLLDFFPL